jgi:hypothetical protein
MMPQGAMGAIVEAVANGDVTPSEAVELGKLVETSSDPLRSSSLISAFGFLKRETLISERGSRIGLPLRDLRTNPASSSEQGPLGANDCLSPAGAGSPQMAIPSGLAW